MKLTKILASTILLFSISSHTWADANEPLAYKVANIKTAGELNVRQYPSASAPVILQMPFDATWILKRTAEHKGNWQKVVWGVKEGWVNSRYIDTDHKASVELAAHRQCVAQHPENSMCCGYPATASDKNNLSVIETFMVIKVPRGQSLNVRSAGNVNAEKIASIPHNAIGIVKFPSEQTKGGNSRWEKIRWNGRDGWVNSTFLKYDPITSDYRNIVQQACSS
ncbi:MAG: Unknown protein [uncultured Thiotrichaceae bacterium]|uniref:SH3b domain-containing protein n=1 Tax=uncultured Thiotrichaceae bacterium TaxID=298394 RepID=A0A6S6TZ35_9GAMM|nr:MAG: Unknown protein [uncultured Thiotrichaceae bacterium]